MSAIAVVSVFFHLPQLIQPDLGFSKAFLPRPETTRLANGFNLTGTRGFSRSVLNNNGVSNYVLLALFSSSASTQSLNLMGVYSIEPLFFGSVRVYR